jgi:hypothetical protein
MTPAELIADVLRLVPEFRPSDPDLASVTCDQLVSFLAAEARDHDQANFARHWPVVLDVFENAAGSGDPQTRDLILVDLIENLYKFNPRCTQIVASLGPNLGACVAEWKERYEPAMGPLCQDRGGS